MMLTRLFGARKHRLAVGGAVSALLAASPAILSSASLSAQPTSSSDSTALVREMRERQAEFEGYRESRIPVTRSTVRASCDERIGRICIWFGGENETDFPPEPVETSRARRTFLVELRETLEQIRDPWVLGQYVHYLTEDGNYREAARVARECGTSETWWCSALLGYVLHIQEDFIEAEAAFREAIRTVPQNQAEKWKIPTYLLTSDGERTLNQVPAAERAQRQELFWELSDPLFLVEGNDRFTEHYARMVEARNQERAANLYSMEWDDDMEESLVRYGRNIGYSRIQGGGAFGGPMLQDNRQVIGHHHPRSRGYIFPEDFLSSPADVPPESWITAPREAHEWYAPPYAPDFRALETQVARFRRSDGVLVVGAYQPAAPQRDPLAVVTPTRTPAPSDPFGPRNVPAAAPARTMGTEIIRGPVQAGLFLVPVDGGERVSIVTDEPSGVLTLQAPTGAYVSSLELFEPGSDRAWRARQGIVQTRLAPGVVALSDLMILRSGATFPETIEEAIPQARPGIRVGQDERFTVVWEAYGLQVNQEIRVTIGFTRGRPGFLQRVGEFLGVAEADRPVEISFEDAGADAEGVQTVFRAVALGLPDLEPGEYTLHLRLDIPGREPTVTSRPILVEPGA